MKDPNEPLRALLFGSGLRKVNLSALAKKTGIPRRTLYEWDIDPGKITVNNLRKLAGAQGIPAEEIGEALKG